MTSTSHQFPLYTLILYRCIIKPSHGGALVKSKMEAEREAAELERKLHVTSATCGEVDFSFPEKLRPTLMHPIYSIM